MIYVHIAFVGFGIDQEYFYITRANYFADLGLFNYAIGNYKKALELSEDPKVIAALGWCYSQIDQLKTSLRYYKTAHRKKPEDIDISLGLAYVQLYNGNLQESKKLITVIEANTTNEQYLQEVERLYGLIEAELSTL